MKRTVTTVESYEWDDIKSDWVQKAKTITTVDDTTTPAAPTPYVVPMPYPAPYNPYRVWYSGSFSSDTGPKAFNSVLASN